MDKPTLATMLVAGEWVHHVSNEHAYDELQDLIDSQPERAWRIIDLLVGCAPDYGVLAAIAAGPVESLLDSHGETFMPVVASAVRTNTRLRICLRAAYPYFPADIRQLINEETADVRDLAVDENIAAVGSDLALVVRWLRCSDTAWASTMLQEMTEGRPREAWNVLQVLAIFADEDDRISSDVFDRAFQPFVRRHFSEFREELATLGKTNPAFGQWIHDQKHAPISDESDWTSFKVAITSS